MNPPCGSTLGPARYSNAEFDEVFLYNRMLIKKATAIKADTGDLEEALKQVLAYVAAGIDPYETLLKSISN